MPTEAPAAPDRGTLRRWLRAYGTVHAEHGAAIQVWVQATEDPLRADRAAAFDWGRRQMVRLLAERRGGDTEVDGLALLGVVEAFGSGTPGAPEVDAAAHVVEHGFLTLDR